MTERAAGGATTTQDPSRAALIINEETVVDRPASHEENGFRFASVDAFVSAHPAASVSVRPPPHHTRLPPLPPAAAQAPDSPARPPPAR